MGTPADAPLWRAKIHVAMALRENDPWPYGLEPNRDILTAFLQYPAEQRYLESTPPVDELFAPIVAWSE
jgi:hypothetical protein